MADKKKYVVTAPYVIATCEGTAAGLYRGAPVPDGATADWIEHALSLDLIAEGEPEGGLVVSVVSPANMHTDSGGGDESAGAKSSRSGSAKAT